MDTSTETETSGELFMHIQLEELTASRFQPKARKPDADLVESVRQHGVVTPGLARPTPDGPTAYEVVFGHCRWAAAAAAERTSMPFVVRQLSDQHALELMLVENLRRSDLHPMDEAEGYHQLHEEHGQAVEQIADRVGKSKAYVYARLKLLALQTEGRDAFRAGDLDASVALYLARVPGTLQGMALKELTIRAGNRDGEKVSAREAAGILQRQFMLQLGEAPFDVADATLVAAAGACTACPKRTGNQRELFADVASADVCSDPVCYRTKVDALWTLRSKAKGAQVLKPRETEQLWPHGYFIGRGEWVRLSDICYHVPGHKTWKELLGQKVAITLARDPDGDVHELVRNGDAQKALVELGLVKELKQQSPSRPGSGKSKAQPEPKKSPARLLAEKVSGEAVAAVVTVAEKKAFTKPVLLAAARKALQAAYADLDERRGLKVGELMRGLPKMTEAQLFGVLVESTVFAEGSSCYGDQVDSDIVDACKAFGVDLKAIEKKAKAELDAAAAKMPAALKAKPVKGKKRSAQAAKHGALGPEGKR